MQWGGQYFLPPSAYLELTGLKCEKEQGGSALTGPSAYLGQSFLGKALIYQGEIYIAATEHSRALIPEQVAALTFWGDVYFPVSHFAGEYSAAELRLERD